MEITEEIRNKFRQIERENNKARKNLGQPIIIKRNKENTMWIMEKK